MKRRRPLSCLFDNLLDWPGRLRQALCQAQRRTAHRGRRLTVEALEDRTLLSGSTHPAPPGWYAHAHQASAAVPVAAPPAPAFSLGSPGSWWGSGSTPPALGSADPLYVLDLNNDLVLPSNGIPINSFSNWSMSLEAQVAGASVLSYSWNFSQAPDATAITGANTYNAQFSWASFTGAARTDVVSVTETTATGSITQNYDFTVAATSSPAWSAAPTSATTWPAVLTPDQLQGQALAPAGPYATVGLADGSVQTSLSLPSYNPNVAPLALVYNSAVANAQPVFQVRYQLNPSQALPSSVTAQLSLTDQSGHTVYSGPAVSYSVASVNPGDWLQIALPANAAGLASGRYNWQVQVTANYSTPVTTTYSGASNLITASTTPTSVTANPFGPGWSLANVQRLIPVSGGVILQNPDGTSLWFANGGTAGTYVSPAGDFSTLAYNATTGVYTRTLTDGTQVNFNSAGQQTSSVDRNGNTTTFTYNAQGQLLSVRDMNGQVNTLTYNSSGLATAITDPAGRTLALTYAPATGQLLRATLPDGSVWTYGYNAAGEMTSLADPRLPLGGPGTYTTLFVYGTAGQVSQVVQPNGTTLALTPAQAQGLAAAGTGTVANPAPAVLLAAASANYTDAAGNVWVTYLDGLGLGQPVSQADPLGDTSLTYRNSNDLAWLTADPLGRRNRYFFDSKGNVTQIVYADDSTGGSSMFTYNSFSEPLQITDAAGSVTTLTYDAKGNLTQVQNALLGITTFSYNSAGLVTGMTDPLGNVWSYSYDVLNRLVGATDPLLFNQAWSYNAAGDVVAYTNQDGWQSTYSYLCSMQPQTRRKIGEVSVCWLIAA